MPKWNIGRKWVNCSNVVIQPPLLATKSIREAINAYALTYEISTGLL